MKIDDCLLERQQFSCSCNVIFTHAPGLCGSSGGQQARPERGWHSGVLALRVVHAQPVRVKVVSEEKVEVEVEEVLLLFCVTVCARA